MHEMWENICQLIVDYVKTYPGSRKVADVWQEPLVGFVAAADPGFLNLKTEVSPTHALPEDILPGARTVIVYFIPLKKVVMESNIPGEWASPEWAAAYIATNRLIFDLNNYLQDKLEEMGFQMAILPATHNFDQEKLISDWSHRHIARIAGLGSFGLNNMLITEKGCCGGLGSIVTDLEITPVPREPVEYCLHKRNHSCQKCVNQCVGKALAASGFDRKTCYRRCLENAAKYRELGLADVCGKCLTGLPCSYLNPVK
jgi:epoxyqueuosine reductase QueG